MLTILNREFVKSQKEWMDLLKFYTVYWKTLDLKWKVIVISYSTLCLLSCLASNILKHHSFHLVFNLTNILQSGRASQIVWEKRDQHKETQCRSDKSLVWWDFPRRRSSKIVWNIRWLSQRYSCFEHRWLEFRNKNKDSLFFREEIDSWLHVIVCIQLVSFRNRNDEISIQIVNKRYFSSTLYDPLRIMHNEVKRSQWTRKNTLFIHIHLLSITLYGIHVKLKTFVIALSSKT